MFSDRDSIYNSPRGVIDVHMFEANEDKILRNLDSLRTPLSMPASLRHSSALTMDLNNNDCSSDGDLPPALRCLSVGTRSLSTCAIDDDDNDDDKDDSSTVSSVSLDDFQESDSHGPQTAATTPAKRCIFASYWNKKGGRPKTPMALSTCEEDRPLSSSSSSDDNDDNSKAKQQSYEDLLDDSAATTVETPTRRSSSGSAPGPRRRLFDSRTVAQYQSEPSLLLQSSVEPLRKTKSQPTVATKRPSCLRPCRFSGSSRRASTSSTSSSASTTSSASSSASEQQRRSSEPTVVSFSDHVQVKYLKADTEKFAAPGWSKYFM